MKLSGTDRNWPSMSDQAVSLDLPSVSAAFGVLITIRDPVLWLLDILMLVRGH